MFWSWMWVIVVGVGCRSWVGGQCSWALGHCSQLESLVVGSLLFVGASLSFVGAVLCGHVGDVAAPCHSALLLLSSVYAVRFVSVVVHMCCGFSCLNPLFYYIWGNSMELHLAKSVSIANGKEF
ncbi:uncharacterized protein LACBIDRAFT_328281 [Laccaria bicolor S238N-H82]|uniref:Predicted protein n=1 Tax=Laccaria bicolor (strain S238N-H82 / ATCC MYA-4686) TaxID=486041 RepID=B0DEE3_LACBS|nr:uncharacterized protein LACBIDRAFT_328281 [Laccaria bicolor S238N-H82]EDR06916.1 predicted protein [Laccaria bicolor S238N-H82]|eukprot:XP_001882289.1 predicted protein [Laccaria bicolor S238N-H82]